MNNEPPIQARAPRTRDRRAVAGFSLIEVVVALAISAITLLGFSQAIVGAVVLNQANHESAEARRAATEVMAELQAAAFFETFARYNSTAADDLAGGDHLLAAFAVDGLRPLDDDADGLVGEIRFPEFVGVGGQLELREDLNDPNLGMPRDLNADGLVDAVDHSGDFQLLPVVVRVEWRGRGGPASIEFKTVLSDL